MREIATRLQENRQIQLAKSILESNGYKVEKKSKRLNESDTTQPNIPCEEVLDNAEAIEKSQDILANPEDYGYDDYPEYLEIEKFILDILKKNKTAMVFSDLYRVDTNIEKEIINTGNDYLCKGSIEYEDEDTEEEVTYSGYIFGSEDGMLNFLYIPA